MNALLALVYRVFLKKNYEKKKKITNFFDIFIFILKVKLKLFKNSLLTNIPRISVNMTF